MLSLSLDTRGELAPLWDSGNNTAWEKYIDVAFMVANCLILSITSVVGIAANLFVLLAVYRQTSLQTSINALVVNLAIIDTLRCATDCPVLLTIVTTVYQRGRVDELICDTQVATFSFSCCIQLLTLSCISAERYQVIAQLHKTTSQSRRRIMILIPVTWTLAFVVAGFCLMFLKDSPVHVRCKGLQRETSLSYDTFGIYMLFPLWAVCFGVIVAFYTRIFILVRAHNRKIFDKGTFPPPKRDKTEDPHGNGGSTVVENGHEKSERNQTLSESVARAEVVTNAEPDSSKKDSTDAPLTSAEAPRRLVQGSGNNTDSRAALKASDVEADQRSPPATRIAVQPKGKPFETEKSSARAQTVEARPSNGDAAAKVKSSATKGQVSSNSEREELSKERAKTDKAPSEMTETRPRVPPPAQLVNPETTSVRRIELKQTEFNDGGELLPVATVDQASSLAPVSNNIAETGGADINERVEGAVCMMPSTARKERASKKKEGKMAKRAGYIILTFLVCWLPLITTILVNFVVHNNKDTQIAIIQDVELLSVSVACITSISDPIIYAAVNPQFWTEFQRLKTRIQSTFNKKL